jgi:hypothetical protein
MQTNANYQGIYFKYFYPYEGKEDATCLIAPNSLNSVGTRQIFYNSKSIIFQST